MPPPVLLDPSLSESVLQSSAAACVSGPRAAVSTALAVADGIIAAGSSAVAVASGPGAAGSSALAVASGVTSAGTVLDDEADTTGAGPNLLFFGFGGGGGHV